MVEDKVILQFFKGDIRGWNRLRIRPSHEVVRLEEPARWARLYAEE